MATAYSKNITFGRKKVYNNGHRVVKPRKPPSPNIIELFTSVIYKCLSSARLFVPGRQFQPGLMLVSKTEAYLSEAPLRRSTLG